MHPGSWKGADDISRKSVVDEGVPKVSDGVKHMLLSIDARAVVGVKFVVMGDARLGENHVP
jgi:hypothetical protein